MGNSIGILGGMGPMATADLFQKIVSLTDAAGDNGHIRLYIDSNASIPDRTAAILSGDTEGLYQRLLADARTLADCGCTALAIPCNTSHYFADRLQGEIGVPIIHMLRETARELARQGKKRPGILGTDGTIQTGLYQKECAALGLEAVAPAPDIQRLVMSIIYDEIKQGEKGSREKFAKVDRAIRSAGCDCAILACTELSVFSTYHPLPPFYLDAMMVMAERAVERCGYPLRTI